MSAWRTSSHCGASNTCVEVAWRTACINDSNCVQVATTPRAVLVRDTTDPDHVLTLTGRQWAGLINAIKEGQ